MIEDYRLQQSRRITLAQQRYHLARVTSGTDVPSRRDRLRWRYWTRPTPLSRRYELLIDYALGDHPKIFTISPLLSALTDNEIPHLYHEAKDAAFPLAVCLCLYKPDRGEWNNKKLLAATIVPWADLWLFYFEDWLSTGIWHGGGEHVDHGEWLPRSLRRSLHRQEERARHTDH